MVPLIVHQAPEATPVYEATQLQEDLKRAGIESFAWIINQSLQSLPVTDPVLTQRKQNEVPFVRNVCASSARTTIVPWQKVPPTGVRALRVLASEPLVDLILETFLVVQFGSFENGEEVTVSLLCFLDFPAVLSVVKEAVSGIGGVEIHVFCETYSAQSDLDCPAAHLIYGAVAVT